MSLPRQMPCRSGVLQAHDADPRGVEVGHAQSLGHRCVLRSVVAVGVRARSVVQELLDERLGEGLVGDRVGERGHLKESER